jgi:hypothetical protein
MDPFSNFLIELQCIDPYGVTSGFAAVPENGFSVENKVVVLAHAVPDRAFPLKDRIAQAGLERGRRRGWLPALAGTTRWMQLQLPAQTSST